MAHYSGYSSNYTEDIWREETLPQFREVSLCGTDQPENGRIYVMYHGTTYNAVEKIFQSGFQQSEDGMLGRGVYVTRDISKAMRYPLGDKTHQVVLKLRVNVGKVIIIHHQNHPMQKTWHQCGYDTAWEAAGCGMVGSELEEDCVWDPRRIKVMGIAHLSPQLLQEFLPLFQNDHNHKMF